MTKYFITFLLISGVLAVSQGRECKFEDSRGTFLTGGNIDPDDLSDPDLEIEDFKGHLDLSPFTEDCNSGFVYHNDQITKGFGLAESSLAISYLQPCSFDFAHQHPFGSEVSYAVEGKGRSGYVTPGFVAKETEIEKGEYFVVPAGTLQWTYNPNCEPYIYVSFFNAARPSRTDIGEIFLASDAVVKGSLLFTDEEYDSTVDDSPYVKGLPDGQIKIVSYQNELLKECAARCGVRITQAERSRGGKKK